MIAAIIFTAVCTASIYLWFMIDGVYRYEAPSHQPSKDLERVIDALLSRDTEADYWSGYISGGACYSVFMSGSRTEIYIYKQYSYDIRIKYKGEEFVAHKYTPGYDKASDFLLEGRLKLKARKEAAHQEALDNLVGTLSNNS